MQQSVQDNRNYYRIEDRAGLEFCSVSKDRIYDENVSFPISVSPHFQLLNQLRSIDADNSQLLRSIGEKDRNLQAYLRGTDQKIELLAQTLASCDDSMKDEHLKNITLSEGGVSFRHYDFMGSGQYLALKLTLLPSCIGLLLYGKVVNYSSDNNGNHLINVSFENISESSRSLIARHVLLYQSKQRRAFQEQD